MFALEYFFSSVFHRKGILGAFHTEFSPPFSVLLFLLSSQFIQLITGQPLTMRIEEPKLGNQNHQDIDVASS